MALLDEARVRLMSDNGTRGPVAVGRDDVLTPSARTWLREHKVEVVYPQGGGGEGGEKPGPRYQTLFGAALEEKPEHMTQLHGDVLVEKGDPRIAFRGKLDSLQAQVVLAQALLHEGGGNSRVIADLGGLLSALREMMRCDVLGEEYRAQPLLGMSHEELRERSHDPMRFFNIQRMELPDYQMGKPYALLNFLRTQAREAEVAAAQAFRSGRRCTRPDLVEALNSMSSALHIMMCMVLAGQYGK